MFTVSYQGGASGHDVILTNVVPPTYYVDTAWAGFANGTAIPDADPVKAGNQPATFGTDAFASVNAAIAAISPFGTVVVNGQHTGGTGNFTEDVLVNKQITLLIQAGPTNFGSLADSIGSSFITLGVDATNAPITLTTGGDNASTTVSAPISGGGSLTKAGTGTMILSGTDTYTGTTTVSAGTLQTGSAAAFGTNPTVTVALAGTLNLHGFSYAFASLAGAGLVQNANAVPVTLTLGATNASTTFSGVLADGAGGGALSLVKTGNGTFTLSGSASSYTGSTTVSGGILSVSTLANGGANSSIGASSNAAANLVLQGGGSLSYTGGTAGTDRGFTLGTGGDTVTDNTPATTLTVGGNIINGANNLTLSGPGNMVFNGIVGPGTGTLTDNGPGNVTFAAANALNTGNITVAAGVLGINTITLSISQTITIAAGAVVASSGTLNLNAQGGKPTPTRSPAPARYASPRRPAVPVIRTSISTPTTPSPATRTTAIASPRTLTWAPPSAISLPGPIMTASENGASWPMRSSTVRSPDRAESPSSRRTTAPTWKRRSSWAAPTPSPACSRSSAAPSISTMPTR